MEMSSLLLSVETISILLANCGFFRALCESSIFKGRQKVLSSSILYFSLKEAEKKVPSVS